jgi:MerR family transcriptional regulator, copper efflux regulator
LPAKTIRFYEEIKLISPAERAENGYRIYQPKAAEELLIIKYARDLGLPIAEIKKLMKGCGDKDCRHTEEYLKKEITDYLGLLEEKITELQNLKSKLQTLERNVRFEKDDCDEVNGYCCNILYKLTKL